MAQKFNKYTMRFEDDEPKISPQKSQASPPLTTPYRQSIWKKIGDFISDAWYWFDDLPGVLRVPLKVIIYIFIMATMGVLIEAIFEILL